MCMQPTGAISCAACATFSAILLLFPMEESIPYAFSMAGKQAAEKGWNSGKPGNGIPQGLKPRSYQ
jgi:hypothetical protein